MSKMSGTAKYLRK